MSVAYDFAIGRRLTNLPALPHSHRHRVTLNGHRQALFLSRTHHRQLREGLAE